MRLDRCMCNPSWLDKWSSSYCLTLAQTVSDHNPIIFNGIKHHVFGPKPFKLYSMWLEHNSFNDVVTSSWQSSPVASCPMRNLVGKLKALKGCLKNWNISVYGDVHAKVSCSRYLSFHLY
ncbi:hypothetical protein ACOSP7_013022 [Xanthoceras sorbifolium]